MKIKELSADKPLGGVRFIHPETNERCIWHSQWQLGVWFKKDPDSAEVFPLFLDRIESALEFEVAE